MVVAQAQSAPSPVQQDPPAAGNPTPVVHHYDEVPLEATGTQSTHDHSPESSGKNQAAYYDPVALDETPSHGQEIVGPWDLLTGNDPMTSVKRRGYESMQMALKNDPSIDNREYQLSRVRVEIRNNVKMVADREKRHEQLEQFEKALNGEIVEFKLWGIVVVPRNCKGGSCTNHYRKDDKDRDGNGAGGSGTRGGREGGKWSREGDYIQWQPSSNASGGGGDRSRKTAMQWQFNSPLPNNGTGVVSTDLSPMNDSLLRNRPLIGQWSLWFAEEVSANGLQSFSQ
ncbi:hypothetical protein [Endozoicomonas arenosclerae]|uniref:hypothetical protein n=1 Tax=Endozoicomonas arenosclerae TaxID=1633495 RepID=UPI000785E782|nr:hypothetical protein [Endozoicomonas arenosclerae]